MIGLIIAMKQELEVFFDTVQDTVPLLYKGKTFYLAGYGGTRLVLALSGVGKVNAAYTAALMVTRFRPKFIINTGVAGGFGLDVLDVFVADGVVQHDIDTTALGDPPGYISGLGKVFISTDEKFVNLCMQNIPGVRHGIIASGDRFVAARREAEAIAAGFGASACDMESGAIGQVAYMAGVRFGIIRTITDNGDDDAKMSFEDKLHKAARINRDAVLSVADKINKRERNES